ncbi:30S ribosomal protein S3 [Candidatus Saccharibacteria bacterium]|nr:30S ribosomal protein S3 [Candidatus Saccharibacteria bacterium]NIV03853.1 30S ribosomal protein S3 [Calditrichia bacterium]NIS38412.1 30S ribosomal protein S3 [Candidatus Saccharibacteria bacterium]NIV72188.1 30S ribosomal protein S3 [Calditrichia bacterium]NIV99101.1 30S ribosomal protein S3 [Candidatus Saccharibacteria bacterium]
MGRKVHPKIFRVKQITSWSSKWFQKKDNYKKSLQEDIRIQDFLYEKLKEAAVDRIEIERSRNNVNIIIHTSKPGFIIGRSGAGIEDLKKQIKDKFFSGSRAVININIQEVSKPALSAAIVAEQIVADIVKRMPYRRVMKGAIDRVQKAGAQGVKIRLSGRLNGVEIARKETLSWGKIPLQNLRADIDYAYKIAKTIYGAIGVKVWIYRGEVFEEREQSPFLKKK